MLILQSSDAQAPQTKTPNPSRSHRMCVTNLDPRAESFEIKTMKSRGVRVSRLGNFMMTRLLLGRMRPILEGWKARRSRDCLIRELENMLRHLDAHTLDDAGFSLMRRNVRDPDAIPMNALVQAIATFDENHPTALK